jgi:predicted small secreted protein
MYRTILVAFFAAACLCLAGCAAAAQGARRQFTDTGQLITRTVQGVSTPPLHLMPPEQLFDRVPAVRVVEAAVQGTGTLAENATR